MFEVIFIFFDWISTELPPTPCLGGNRFSKNSTRNLKSGTEAWVKKHVGKYMSEKTQQVL